MPWTCVSCDKTLSDEIAECPGCKGQKSAWTLVAEKTRTFQVSSKRVEYLRGQHTVAHPADAQPVEDRLEAATAITVLEKGYLVGLAEEGKLPPSRYVVVARLTPRAAKDKTVVLEVNFEEDPRGVEELRFPQETEPTLREDGTFDVRFVFFHGEHEAEPIFEGIHAVDLTERHDNAAGVKFAPSVDASALKRDPYPLPTQEPGVRVRLVHLDGTPVKASYRVYLEPKLEGELDEQGALSIPGATPAEEVRVRYFRIEDLFLSARFFDATGRFPAADLRFRCGDREGRTDQHGLALLTALPCEDQELEFRSAEGEPLGKTVVPVVHDPAIVVRKNLSFFQISQAVVGAPQRVVELSPRAPGEGEQDEDGDGLQKRYPSGEHPEDADDPEDGPEAPEHDGDAVDPHPDEED